LYAPAILLAVSPGCTVTCWSPLPVRTVLSASCVGAAGAAAASAGRSRRAGACTTAGAVRCEGAVICGAVGAIGAAAVAVRLLGGSSSTV
jgi:hypothetical protein